MTRTALVTRGNRGIGLEACRQLARAGMRVVLAARDPQRGHEAAQKLRDEGLDVISERLDVANSQSVKNCAQRLTEVGTEVNVLVNNAGVYPTQGVFSVSEETFEMALEVNTLGAFRTCRAFVLIMMQRNYGRVINVSSGGGSFGEGLGPAAYAVSKAALNTLTVKVAQAVQGNVKVNAMCPGWVRPTWEVPARLARPRRPWILWFGSGPLLNTVPTAAFSGTGSYPLVVEREPIIMGWFRQNMDRRPVDRQT